MHYKAIGFDYGGVVKGRPGSFFTVKICKMLGITKEQYQDAYFRHNKKVNRGEITWTELWTQVLTELGHPDKVEAVMALSNSVFDQKINNNVVSLVDRLRDKGYRVGLLSNNTTEAGQKMRELGIDKHFDVLHVSAETGLVKPEPDAFYHFAKALNVPIKELIFIDDAEKSLSTANQCGFIPILFESYDKLITQLDSLKVL